MRTLLAILMTVTLGLGVTSCATYKDRIVKVPSVVHAEVPRPAEVTKPHLPIYDLHENSSDEETARAVITSMEMLEAYAKALQESMKPFNKDRQK